MGLELGKPDSFFFDRKCGIGHYMYYYPEITVTISNHSNYPVSQINVGYEDFGSHCCVITSWEQLLTNTDIQPGETKTFILPVFRAPNYYHFSDDFAVCVNISNPDNHPDDFPEDNYACLKNLMTNLTEPQKSLLYFPNPASDRIYFNQSLEENTQIMIFDIHGKIHLDESIPSNQSLDINKLIVGVYFIQFIATQGQITVEKLVKQ